MHPAPSIIVFTVLSGLGLGLLAWLGLAAHTGWVAFWWFALGYGLTLAGLAASAFHLGHPERALLAFTQWRSSWLSREAVLSAAALLAMAPHAASSVFLGQPLPVLGAVASMLCLATVVATAMIYAQLRTVPNWHHAATPALFLSAALAGGALLTQPRAVALALLAALAVALVVYWWRGVTAFQRAGSDTGTATGLGVLGAVRLLEPPHTGPNYLLREMVHVVGRKHALRLRQIAVTCALILPAALIALAPDTMAIRLLAVALHVAGMLAARWLFFAEARHVVGLYYATR